MQGRADSGAKQDLFLPHPVKIRISSSAHEPEKGHVSVVTE